MGLTAQQVVDLVKALAWPIVVIWALALLRQPISGLINRTSKISISKGDFKTVIEATELHPFPVTAISWLQEAVTKVQSEIVEISVLDTVDTYDSGLTQLGAGDYVLVALGADADHRWLTSRLFLMSAILEWNWTVRCIVFTGERDAFLGVTTPGDVRIALGAKFPEYERALFRAYGAEATSDLGEFRAGELSKNAIERIVRNFLLSDDLVRTAGRPPKSGREPPIWELAEWVTGRSLRSTLRDRLAQGSIIPALGPAETEENIRAIVRQAGEFVAMLNASGSFEQLIDRGRIVDKLARIAVEQIR
jgi:hypothetical protein